MNKLNLTPKIVNIAYNVTAKFANSLLLSYFKYLGLFLRLFADNDDGADGAATLARMAFG